MDEYTARRKADADFVHEQVMLADARAEGAAKERERWELHLSAVTKLAEANSKRGDDCGMLARTFLDTLKAMKYQR